MMEQPINTRHGNTEKDVNFYNTQVMKNTQKQYSRRGFIEKTALAGAAGLLAPGLNLEAKTPPTPQMTHDDISLALSAIIHAVIKEISWWEKAGRNQGTQVSTDR